MVHRVSFGTAAKSALAPGFVSYRISLGSLSSDCVMWARPERVPIFDRVVHRCFDGRCHNFASLRFNSSLQHHSRGEPRRVAPRERPTRSTRRSCPGDSLALRHPDAPRSGFVEPSLPCADRGLGSRCRPDTGAESVAAPVAFRAGASPVADGVVLAPCSPLDTTWGPSYLSTPLQSRDSCRTSVNARNLIDLVNGALRNSDADSVELHARCGDEETARKIGEMILGSEAGLDAKETWLRAITEIHPNLAAPFGRELLRLRAGRSSSTPDAGP